MNEKLITLLSYDEIMISLNNIDTGHIEQLWKKIAQHTNKQKYPIGIVMLIELAIYDYCEGMPSMIRSLLEMRIPQIITAIVPDQDEYSTVINVYNELIETKEKV